MDPKIRSEMEALERLIMAREFEKTTEPKPKVDAWGNPYVKRKRVSEVQLTDEEKRQKHIETMKEYTQRIYRCDKDGNPIPDVNGRLLRDKTPFNDPEDIEISGYRCKIWQSADGATFVSGLPDKSPDISESTRSDEKEPSYTDTYVQKSTQRDQRN